MTESGNTGSLPEPTNTVTSGAKKFPARWYIITADETNEILMNLALAGRTVQGPAREHLRMAAEIIKNVERRLT
ncbi:hypothetical protein [Methanoregula sp. UBA64]|jgi:hypothetical protein|uniref:hypothetical protein n=1 Tax=Methanoregula sp. UBA64 TaxID=1915554 RepID=UPI0025CF6E76|nr:hypothetical protein [Methanoregula sp. UBA64]